MRVDRFADRLDRNTYDADDEVVGIYEADPDEDDAVWCSARLFRRLTGIGRAYELPALPLLDGSHDVQLNRTQCLSLLDEIEFVAERVDDDLLVGLSRSFAAYLTVRVHRSGWHGLITIGFD